ncbi:MAG: phage terminase large subunit [Alphaproteobacteria bacterium]|nr:phage terminase large subunit [Alphaproteobacteria bacterium]
MTDHAIREADFRLFLVLWNQRLGLRTPAIHLRMAEWLERGWKTGQKNLLLMAFRSSGKSTVAGLFAAWVLYRKPELRILVLAADFDLAGKMVRNVKRIIERHPLAAYMKPAVPDQWATDRFTVKRMIELRDPSMMARGVSSNITGSRADIIICDDVEVPGTCDTAAKRADLRERLGEIPFVLVPGGMQIYIGTPHNYFSIYAAEARTEIAENTPFLEGFRRLEIPVLDAEENSAWPERFSPQNIAAMRRRSGLNRFESQMMLRPVNIAQGRLDPGLLHVYDEDLYLAKELGALYLGGKKMISASAWWDPAFGAAGGDKSAFAAIFSDEVGDLYLHHLEYIKTTPGDEIDEATQQCRIVAQIARRLMLPSLCVEINGIGKFLPAILRNELARAKAPCAVKEISSRRAKDLRILEAFDTVMAARILHVHRAVLGTPFIGEMREWRPGSSRGHDDGLDAVAGALGQQPVRIKRLYGGGGHGWMKGGQSHRAETGFEV